MKLAICVKKYDNEYEKYAFRAIAYALFFGAGTYGIKAIVTGIGFGSLQTAASFLIYVGWFIVLLRLLCRYFSVAIDIIIMEVIVAVLLYASYSAFPLTQPYYEEYAMFLRQSFVVYLPSGVLVYHIKNFNNCFKYTRGIAFYGSIFMLISYALGYIEVNGYQYWGVHLSPMLLLLFGNYMDKKEKADLIMVIIDCVMILFGGRQSLFVTVVGICLMYFTMSEDKKQKRTLVTIISLLVILIMCLASNVLLSILSKFLEAFDINTRTTEMLLNGELVDISTREIIYESSIKAINNNQGFNGILADRYLLRQYGDWMAYPHNVFLEFILDFGMIFGGIISILLVFLVITNLMTGTKERKTFSALLISLVFIRLMVSSSFVIEGLFYTMLGFLFQVITTKLKKVKKKELYILW